MKKKDFLWSLLAIVMAATVGFGFSSCTDDDDEPELSVSRTSLNLAANGDGDKDIIVTAAHTDWTANVINGSSWLRVNKNGEQMASISADPNNTTQTRKGTVRIVATKKPSLSFDIEISQEAADFILVNGQNTTSLTFDAAGGISYKQTVRANSNVGWQILNVPEWLSVSPTNGNGEISIDVYPRNSNDENDDLRTADLKLIANGSPEVTATIVVEQYSDLDKEAYVKPTNIVTLYNGIAFDYEFGKNVSYYYRGYMEKTAVASMTETEIIKVLEENFSRYTQADDEVADFGGLDEGKTYMVYTIGYNKNGKRGKLIKTEVTTKTLQNNEPMAWISDPTTDGSYWYWSVEKNATCYSYYMITTEDIDFALSSDVLQAWSIDYNIRQGWITEFVNGGDWYQQRSGSLIAVMTWGLDRKDTFASTIDWNLGMDSSSSSNKIQKQSKNTRTDRNSKKIEKGKLTIYKRK